MSLFSLNASKNLNWLIIAIGLLISAVVSTSAIAHVKPALTTASNVSKSTQTIPNNNIPNNTVIDKVFVDKSERVLKLLSDDKVIKTYRIALGDSPIGHKKKQGDERTPTGTYTLDYKNEKSKFYRSIHISYPNTADKARAKALGVSPGGDIMIHGQKNGFAGLASLNQQRDWTDGCIAVTNDEMDEIMAVVKLGIPIEIVE